MMTNGAAQQMYYDFNRKWFGNKLPKDMVVYYARLERSFGVTHAHRNRPLYIELDWDLRKTGAGTAMTLLHEMVHVKDMSGGHGPRFHKEMLRLAKAGAFKHWW